MIQKNKTSKPSAISYIYISTIKQGDDNSGLRYTQFIQEEVHHLGAEIVREFSDYGAPADPAKRPGLQKLLTYLSKKKIDYLIVPHFSMLSRQARIMLELADRIELSGARLITPSGEENHMHIYRWANIVNETTKKCQEMPLWAACTICHKGMSPYTGCIVSSVSCNGREYERIRSGDARDFNPNMEENDVCHDCNVGPGQYHHWGCDAEQCPFCGNQLIGCDCDIEVLMKQDGARSACALSSDKS